MKKYLLFYICIQLLSIKIYSQDLTGIWQSDVGIYEKLVLVQRGDSLFGYAHDIELGFCKTNFLGTFNKSKLELRGSGVNFIARSFGHSLARYVLHYKDNGINQTLIGNAYAKGTLSTALSFGLPKRLHLIKLSNKPDTITAFMDNHLLFNETVTQVKKDSEFASNLDTNEITIIPDSTVTVLNQLNKRQNILVKTIEASGIIKLSLYDNGIIDGDTITLFHNDSILLYKYKLTDKPKVLELSINESAPTQTITMLANNLGLVPPNTALLVIEINNKRYEISLSSDFSTNAVVKFIYKQ